MAGTRTGWVGWIIFAGAMMMLSGLFNLVTGLVAIFDDEIYVNGPRATVVFDLTAWGWIHVILGFILFVIGIALLGGYLWARLTAVVIVGLNMLTQLLELPAYPLFSIIIIALNVFIMYALLVHGEEMAA
jgi:hypothetical protein